MFREGRGGRNGQEREEAIQFRRGRGHEVAIPTEDVLRLVELDTASGLRRSSRPGGPKQERCDDAEVAAATADRPEELCVRGRACRDKLAGGQAGRRLRADCRASARACESGGRRHRQAPGRRSRSSRRCPSGRRARTRGSRGRGRPGYSPARPAQSSASGSTRMPRSRPRSMTRPSSTVPKPAPWWPPPRTAIFRSWSIPKRSAVRMSRDIDRPGDRRRPSIHGSVEHSPRVVVARVLPPDHLSSEAGRHRARWPPRRAGDEFEAPSPCHASLLPRYGGRLACQSFANRSRLAFADA